MPGTLTEAQHRAMILRAIKHAEDISGSDDAEFVRALRAHYFAGLNKVTRGLRLVPLRMPGESPRSFHIYEDPRYLASARALARRTAKGERIIGGTTAGVAKFPDCAAVGNDSQWGCTGTLIAPNVVLTAGHCKDFATRVLFGNDVTKKAKVVPVATRVRHPRYHHGQHNDLMVLILAQNATSVAPRPIAPTSVIDHATDGRVVGFGATEPSGRFGYGRKRQTDVPVASASCTGSVDGRPDPAWYGCDKTLELVAGKPLLEHDTCNGDSGGPLYVAGPDGRWLLAAVTSRATDSAVNNCGDGGIYVRVDRYRDWIASIPNVHLPTP